MCQMNTGALISFHHNWAPASIVYTDRLYEQEGCVVQWLGCSGWVRGEMLHSGSRGCPIINPLPVAPTVQMVPGAHMASNPVIGILLSELPPTLSLLPPPSPHHPSPLKHGAKSKSDLIDQSCCFIHLCLSLCIVYIYIYIYKKSILKK